MSGSQLLRVLLCGVVAGILWSLLSSAALLLAGSEFLAVVESSARHPRSDGAVFFAVDLLMGIWAVWLYSAIAPKYGSGLKTAAFAGFSWWLLKTLQSAKWVALGFLPAEVTFGPVAATFIAAMVAAITGSQLYDRVTIAPRRSPMGPRGDLAGGSGQRRGKEHHQPPRE